MTKRKAASTYEVIQELKSKGSKVSYRKRKDGGYIITEINGIKYTGAAGNKIARAMTGKYLTQAQSQQRIRTTAKKASYYESFDKETKTALRTAQKAWREYKKSGGVQDRSRISAKQVKRNIKKYGIETAKSMLIENTKYARHIAYRENVEDLIERIERVVATQTSNKSSDDWTDILEFLKANIDNIHEENQRQKILNALYDEQNHIHTHKETGNYIRQILGLPIK